MVLRLGDPIDFRNLGGILSPRGAGGIRREWDRAQSLQGPAKVKGGQPIVRAAASV